MIQDPRNAAALSLLAIVSTGCSTSWDAGDDDPPAALQRYFDTHFAALGDGFVMPWSRDQLAMQLGGARVLYLGELP